MAPFLGGSRIAREAARLAPARGMFDGLFSDNPGAQPSPRELIRPRYDNSGRRLSIFDDGVDAEPDPIPDPEPERPIARMAKRLNAAYDAASEFIGGPKQAIDLGVGLGADYLKRRGVDLGIDTDRGNEAGQLLRKIPNVLSAGEAAGNAVWNRLPRGIADVGRGAQEGILEKGSALLTDPMMALVPEHRLAAAAFLPGIIKGAGTELGEAGAAALEGDYPVAARHAAGGLVDTGFSILGGLHAGGPRRIEAAAARLAEEKARAAGAQPGEAPVATQPGDFRVPDAQPLVPEERPFTAPQPDIYEGVDLGAPPPVGPGFQPEAPPVDAMAEREFLRPNFQAFTDAEQARLLRMSRQEAPPLTSAIQAALAGEPGAPRLAPPPIGPGRPAEIPGLGTDFTVSPQADRILRGRAPMEEPVAPLPVPAAAAEPLAALAPEAPPAPPAPPPEPPPAATAAPVEPPRPPAPLPAAARAEVTSQAPAPLGPPVVPRRANPAALDKAVEETVPAAITALSQGQAERGGKVFAGTEHVTTLGTGMHPAKVEFGLGGIPEGAKTIASALRRDKGNPLELRAREAMRARIEEQGGEGPPPEAPAAAEQPRGPERRQQAVHPVVERRLVERREAIATEKPHLQPADVEDLAQAQVAKERHRLTGYPERELFDKAVAEGRYGAYASADGRSFGILNKTHGHVAGDSIIKAMADVIHAAVTPHGVDLFHTGGDEFRLGGKDLDAVRKAAEAAQADLFGATIEHVGPDGKTSTIELPEVDFGYGKRFEDADAELGAIKLARKRATEPGAVAQEPSEGREPDASPEGRADVPAGRPETELAPPPQYSVREKPSGGEEDRGFQTLKELRDHFTARGIDNFVGERGDTLTLSKVVVPKDQRGGGIGSEFMRALTEYADANGKRVALSPSTDFGGSSVGRLKDFYKQFGFVENKGRNKDFRISESMIREPKKPQYSVRPSPGQRGLEDIGEDVAPPREKTKKPEQSSMFGGEMLQASETRTTEGREGEGALFTQDAAARARAEKDSQGGIKFSTAAKDGTTPDYKQRTSDLWDRLHESSAPGKTQEKIIGRFLNAIDNVYGDAADYKTWRSAAEDVVRQRTGTTPPKYAERGTSPAEGRLTLADVRQHIRAPGITETPEGFQFGLRHGGRDIGVFIDRVGDIHLDPKAFASGRPGQSAEGLEAVGSYQRVGDIATIKLLAKVGETPRTLLHESWHLIKDLGLLNEGEQRAIEKKYGPNEEAQADAYADWNPAKRPDGIFGKIASFFRNVYRSFKPSAESAFEKVRSGKVFEGKGATAPSFENYDNAPKAPKDEVFGTPDRPAPAHDASAMEEAAARVEQAPSPAQQANGNFAKGHVKWNGLDIALETPKGGTRTAKDGSWSVEDYPAHYGYVKRTIGKDGDHVDVFMGDEPTSDHVWVVDQKNKAGAFDEHKALLGFPSKDEAIQAYRDAYKDGLADKLLGDVTEMSADGFKEWVREGDTKKPLGGEAPRYATAPKMPPQIRPIPPKPGPVSVPPNPASAGAAKNPTQAFTLPEETLVDAAARTFQDKLRRLEVVEGAVGKQGGKVRPAGENVKAAADALGAKVAAAHERIRDEYVEPLTQLLGEKKTPLSDLDDYMAILHAPDRDAAILKRTDGKVTEGSGWTAAERTKRFGELEKKYGAAKGGRIAGLEPAADIVRKMRDEQLRVLEDGGLLSKQQIAGWKKEMGDNYVPFRTIEAQEGIGTGQGFDIRGKESKSATGRSTKADSPVTFMLQQLYRAAVRAEKNKVDQRFADFVRDNKLFEMDKEHERTELGSDGKVKTVRDVLRDSKDFSYKVDGETHRIDIAETDPLLDRAMRNLSSQERNIVVDHLGSLTRRFSQLVTSRNPSFVLPNFVRDVQQAVTSIGVEHGGDVAKNALKGMGPALKEMFRAARDPKKASQMAREFKEDGGAVGWYQVKNIAELEKDLTGRIREVHGGAARRVWRSMWDGIDSVNHSIENATRFATYKALRDAGASREKAATAARNVTVDFTKKGEAGPTINALYAFFNAGIQGSKRMKEVLVDSPKGRALAASMVASGMAMDAYNRTMAGDDNKDGTNDYDAIPEYVKSRNWVVMRGEGKKPLLVPLPHGLNVLHTTGRQIMGALQGATTPGQAAMSVVGSAANALNPLGGDSGLVQMLSPTFLDPFVQHATNKTWSGRPLKPETFPGAAAKPESEMYFKNAPPAAIAIARWLNDHTGGDKVTPGLISVSPEVLSLYADTANSYLTGGLGKDIVRAGETAKSIASGEPPSIRNVPVAGRFIYEGSPGEQSQRFRENADELATLWQRYKTYRQDGNIESIKTLPVALLKAKKTFDAIENRIQSLRRAAKARPELEQQIEGLQLRANRLVASAKRAAKQQAS